MKACDAVFGSKYNGDDTTTCLHNKPSLSHMMIIALPSLPLSLLVLNSVLARLHDSTLGRNLLAWQNVELAAIRAFTTRTAIAGLSRRDLRLVAAGPGVGKGPERWIVVILGRPGEEGLPDILDQDSQDRNAGGHDGDCTLGVGPVVEVDSIVNVERGDVLEVLGLDKRRDASTV